MATYTIGGQTYETMPLYNLRDSDGNIRKMPLNPGGQMPYGYTHTTGVPIPGEDSGIVENGPNGTSYIPVTTIQNMFNQANDPNLRNIGTAERPMYVPKGSAGEQNYNENIDPNRPQQPPTTTTPTGVATPTSPSTPPSSTPSGGLAMPPGFSASSPSSTPVPGTPGGSTQTPAANTSSSGLQYPSSLEALNKVYASRPDLQQLYNPDGTAKDPNNKAIAGIPTLQDWARVYGAKEYTELDPRVESLLRYYTLDEIKKMPEDIKTGLAAFADVQQKNFEAGKVSADINAKTWEDAMRIAAQDPEINAKYGEELAFARSSIGKTLELLDQGYTMEQAATAREQDMERKRLADAEAAAGRAYSGFREQAETRLGKEQSDVITSSRMRLKSNLQSLLQPFEQRFGTSGLSAFDTEISGERYDPTNNVQGSAFRDKQAEQKALAADFFNTTKLPA